MVPARGRRWGWGVPGSPSSSRDSWSPFRAGGQQRGQNSNHTDTPANPQSSFPHLWLTQVTEGEVQVLDENMDGAFGDPDDFLIPWRGEFRCHRLGLSLYLPAHPSPHSSWVEQDFQENEDVLVRKKERRDFRGCGASCLNFDLG